MEKAKADVIINEDYNSASFERSSAYISKRRLMLPTTEMQAIRTAEKYLPAKVHQIQKI